MIVKCLDQFLVPVWLLFSSFYKSPLFLMRLLISSTKMASDLVTAFSMSMIFLFTSLLIYFMCSNMVFAFSFRISSYSLYYLSSSYFSKMRVREFDLFSLLPAGVGVFLDSWACWCPVKILVCTFLLFWFSIAFLRIAPHGFLNSLMYRENDSASISECRPGNFLKISLNMNFLVRAKVWTGERAM